MQFADAIYPFSTACIFLQLPPATAEMMREMALRFTYSCQAFYFLGSSKVCQLDMPRVVEQKICPLDVSMHDTMVMKVFQPEQYLPRIDPDNGFIEFPCKPEQRNEQQLHVRH